MTDTPKTDAAAMQMPMKPSAESPSGWCSVVRSSFARELEREVAAARQALDPNGELTTLSVAQIAALRSVECVQPTSDPPAVSDNNPTT